MARAESGLVFIKPSAISICSKIDVYLSQAANTTKSIRVMMKF